MKQITGYKNLNMRSFHCYKCHINFDSDEFITKENLREGECPYEDTCPKCGVICVGGNPLCSQPKN